MITKLIIWRTFTDALSRVVRHIPLYLKGIAVPLAIFIASFIPMFFQPVPMEPVPGMMPTASMGLMGLIPLIQLLLVIWIGNIAYRITLTGEPGKLWWTMRETWTVIWLILLNIITAIGAGIPAVIGYFAIGFINPVAAIASAFVIYGLGSYYLLSRLVPLIPSIAIGEKKSLGDIWHMTHGNGIRIMIAMLLPILLFLLTGAVLGSILAVLGLTPAVGIMIPISMVVVQLISIVIVCILATLIALIYQQLKQ